MDAKEDSKENKMHVTNAVFCYGIGKKKYASPIERSLCMTRRTINMWI